ncbi:hypothetical protein [Synechococcus sp. M16CYN]|uniref:hypothetical protein n=1 Tax=Synechococcus sp. M16CYN TaxID=3103139 RepID=UPI00333EC5D6
MTSPAETNTFGDPRQTAHRAQQQQCFIYTAAQAPLQMRLASLAKETASIWSQSVGANN